MRRLVTATWRAWTAPTAGGRLLAVLTLLIATTYVVGIQVTSGDRGARIQGDARSYFAYLPSLVLDRDLDLRNQFVVLRPEGNPEYPYGVGYQGRAQNPFPIAPALLWFPGYLAGLGVDLGVGSPIANGQPLGFGTWTALATAAWSIVLVGIGAEATRRLVMRTIGPSEALPATVMAWLATSALYYSMITPLYSHAPGWFATSLMLWLAWRAAEHPERTGLWIASGLAAGCVIAVRLQDIPLLLVPAAVLSFALYRTRLSSRALPLAAAWIAAVAAGYLPQGLTYYWLHGAVIPHGVNSTLPSLPAALDILFSVGYQGWISWTPIVLPGLIGLGLLAARADRDTTRVMALSAIAGIIGLLLLDLVHPYGRPGAAFGGRRYVSATPLLALGLGTLLSNRLAPRISKTAWAFLPALTVWNLCVLLSYELLIIRHDTYPTLLQVVRYMAGLGIS